METHSIWKSSETSVKKFLHKHEVVCSVYRYIVVYHKCVMQRPFFHLRFASRDIWRHVFGQRRQMFVCFFLQIIKEKKYGNYSWQRTNVNQKNILVNFTGRDLGNLTLFTLHVELLKFQKYQFFQGKTVVKMQVLSKILSSVKTKQLSRGSVRDY